MDVLFSLLTISSGVAVPSPAICVNCAAATPTNAAMEWIKTLGPTLGILAGFGSAIFAYRLRQQEAQKEAEEKAKRLASALAGEVLAISDHVIAFRYIPYFRYLNGLMKKGKDVKIPPRNSSSEFFSIYFENANDIGLLPQPLPQRVAGIYTKFAGVKEDLRTVIKPKWNALDVRLKRSTISHLCEELQQLEREGREIGKALLNYANANTHQSRLN